MTDNTLIGYTVEDGVATILFNRPDKMNALTPSMLAQFLSTVQRAAGDPEARVFLITGAGGPSAPASTSASSAPAGRACRRHSTRRPPRNGATTSARSCRGSSPAAGTS